MVGRRRWRMELMGIGSSRIKETSRNRLYACLGCAGLREKNPKTIVHEETISKEKRRKSMIKKCSMLKPSMFNASFPLCEILVPRSRRVVQLVPLHPSPHSTPKRMVLQYNQRRPRARPISPLFCISMTLSCHSAFRSSSVISQTCHASKMANGLV